MQIAAFVLGVIGALTGTVSLVIKLIEFYHDRARLVIEVSLYMESSKKFPIPYFSLQIVFMNRGRRPITIIDGAIELPARDMFIAGNAIPVSSAEQPLFKAGTQAGLTIESHKRQQLVFEPFDATLLKDCAGKARAFFTDAIGNRYGVDFLIPDAAEILKISGAWAALRKQQQSDATNPAKHPQ